MKVLSYNIQEGGQERLAAIAAVILHHQPDGVALLEAMEEDKARTLAEGLRMQFVFGEANRGVHVAWLSRLPIRRAENHRLSILAKTLLEIEVEWQGMPVRLFATHLASRWDPRLPAEEVAAILDVLRPLADQPHLLVGDFNALHPHDGVGVPPPGVAKRGDAVPGAPRAAIRLILEAGYVDCYRVLHSQEPGYTYPSDNPWLRLDYLFAGRALAPCLVAAGVSTGDGESRASDHLPVWAEFRRALR